MSRRLLLLYPAAWRERYGAELEALLEDSTPSLGITLDLLRGALLAHLRPLQAETPTARARGSVTAVLGLFIVFCFFGAGFAKTTENYDWIEHVHPELGTAHAVILVAAIAAGSALALAAVPLALAALTQAIRTRDRSLMRLIVVPPTAIAVFAGSLGLLSLWLHAHRAHAGVVSWLLLALCTLCAGVASFACWSAARAIVGRLDDPPPALSTIALAVVALGMTVVAAATGVFLVGLLLDAPRMAASGNGPGGLIDVTTSIAVQFAALLALAAAAALSAGRGLGALAGGSGRSPAE